MMTSEDADDYTFVVPEAAFVAGAGAMAVKNRDVGSRRVVSTYAKQLSLGESIYDYPPGGWDYEPPR